MELIDFVLGYMRFHKEWTDGNAFKQTTLYVSDDVFTSMEGHKFKYALHEERICCGRVLYVLGVIPKGGSMHAVKSYEKFAETKENYEIVLKEAMEYVEAYNICIDFNRKKNTATVIAIAK